MRFLTQTAASYVGVDLHARTLFVCVLDQAGAIRVSRNLPAKPEPFLAAVAPFRPDLLVGCECVHTWYWLADTCRRESITFSLRHAGGMKAVHGPTTNCDRHHAAATSPSPTPTPTSGEASATSSAPASASSASGPSCTATSTPSVASSTSNP